MKRLLFPLACITLAAAPLALAACGSDSSSAGTETAARAASGDPFPDTKTCPEKSPSFDWSGSILNRLPVAVSLAAGEYTCNDWSGVSTPGAVLDGKVLEPITTTYQNSFGFSLEPRKNTTREWTMQFAPADGGEPYGRARVYLTKEAMWTALEIPAMQSAIDLENRQQIMSSHTEDARESMRAFMEKRPPKYSNR